jgi:hypothetical protein
MSRRIFLDIEEAISREVRRISHHESRTLDKIVMQDTYDPFSGEVIAVPIEPQYYDSSADAHNVNYPHFFVRLMKTREDRFSGREVSLYGKKCLTPSKNSPKAFQIVSTSADGLISAVGNELTTGLFQIGKVQAGFLIRLLTGNNKGTYKVDSVVPSGVGDHSIFVSSDIVEGLPASLFEGTSRVVTFQGDIDLGTVKIGDVYEDALAAAFNITAIDTNAGTITIDGVPAPDLALGSKITRSGDIFTSTDLSFIRFIVMDPSKPVKVNAALGQVDGSDSFVGVSPEVPIDAFYRIRIDSKTRENHIDVLNRVWEEFNPPRTGLPVIRRTALSADVLLTTDVPGGGSTTIKVEDNANINIGDTIFIFDDLGPTKRVDGEGQQRPFTTTVVSKTGTDELELADTVPDTYLVSNCTKIVSNAEYKILMFHFVDHVTRDVEGSQYWVHEFTFWVQLWIDRLEEASETTVVTEISTPIEDLDGNIIIDDL